MTKQLSDLFLGKRLVVLFVFFLFIINSAVGYEKNQGGAADQLFLWRYYQNLGDLLFENRNVPGNLELAVFNLEKATKILPQKESSLWKLSRALWLQAERESQNKRKFFLLKKAILAGEKAVALNTENSKSQLWLALSLGSLAIEGGMMRQMSSKDRIKKALQKSLHLNNKEVEALLGLSSWYYYVPPFLGGDKQKAYRLLAQARSVDPCFTPTYKVEAGFYLADKRFMDARRVLKQLLHIQYPTSRAGGLENKALARVLLKQIESAVQ